MPNGALIRLCRGEGHARVLQMLQLRDKHAEQRCQHLELTISL
jgi:hypothetical protein